MTINYTTYTQQIANMMPTSTGDTNFLTMLPGMIDYAEQRIYREADLLRTQVTDATTAVSSGNRSFNLPTGTGTYITTDNINIITPAGTPASSGTRVQLTPTSREFLDIVYPSGQTATGVPEFFAMASDTQVIFGPAPDAPYIAEVIGVQRPLPLSSGNSSTILTQYVPDLMIAASMIFASAYMRNFGAESADPQMSVSWEAQYTKLFASVAVEQARASFESEGWTSKQPSPIATPKRV